MRDSAPNPEAWKRTTPKEGEEGRPGRGGETEGGPGTVRRRSQAGCFTLVPIPDIPRQEGWLQAFSGADLRKACSPQRTISFTDTPKKHSVEFHSLTKNINK